MNIWKTIGATLRNAAFYEEARDHTTGRVVKYYAKLSIILGLVVAIYGVVVVSPNAIKGMNKFGNEVVSSYPADLTVTISRGQVSTNASSEPVILPFPSYLREEMIRESKGEQTKIPANLAVIDTRSTSTISFDEFKSLDTSLFVGKTYMISLDEGGSITYGDLSKAPNFTLNKAFLDKILSITKFFWILIPIMMFFAIFVGTFITLLYLLLLSLITMLIARLTGRKFTYAESYRITVYASTWPNILLLLATPFLTGVPFLFSLLTLIISVINLPPKNMSIVSASQA